MGVFLTILILVGLTGDTLAPLRSARYDKPVIPTEGRRADKAVIPTEGRRADKVVIPTEGWRADKAVIPTEGWRADKAVIPTEGRRAEGEDLLVLFWNLENFFDYREIPDQVRNDGERGLKPFSSRGERHWTRRRFYTKCNAIAKALLWIGSREGRLPDVFGVAEVENSFVLRRLLQATILRKLDYGIVHRESPDKRGIDVALLYRKRRFDTLSVSLRKLYEGAVPLSTRGILCVTLGDRTDGSRRHYLVNHHPSKYGGVEASEQRRSLAVGTLRHLTDSLGGEIIAMGDFNDTPLGGVYDTLRGPLVGKADSLVRAGRGTIRFAGRWELIDAFFTSPSVSSEMDIIEIPFLMTKDNTHAGQKPLRTYSGPRYTGGVSDHLPVILKVYKE